MSHLYRVHYHKALDSSVADVYLFRGHYMLVEDVLTNFRLEHPDCQPLSVRMDGCTIWTIKDELACPYCGGIDAHLPKCKGGYGL